MIAPLILIVDDDPLIVALLSRHMVAAGLGVVTATDGRGAVAAVKRHRPDLIVMDVEMPELTGLQALRQMRTRKAAPPTIMLTSRRRPAEVVEGVMAGAKVYMTKPFDPDDVLMKIISLLDSPRIAAALDKSRFEGAPPVSVASKQLAA